VAQSKSNLERPVGGFDVNPIAPAVVPNPAAPPIRINDVAPTVATAKDLAFVPIDIESVPQDAHPDLDGHDSNKEFPADKRSRGIPVPSL